MTPAWVSLAAWVSTALVLLTALAAEALQVLLTALAAEALQVLLAELLLLDSAQQAPYQSCLQAW